ncbi:YcxB family protein [Streptomyces sp. NBC_01351]|uniref:YcxB family protein n=1 Tax=Streptomyces sp. NBC_01351 TaxID=2903833 RepID=UPI002E344495|nr:YcxB family protein [Streptomyces sp. NBC_01351]
MDDMGGDQLYRIHEPAAGGQAVELHYTPTTADMAEALRARNKTRAGRRQRRPWIYTGLLGPVPAAAMIVQDGEVAPVTVGLLTVIVFSWVFVFSGHRIMARAYRGVLEAAGDCRAVVDGDGVAVTGSRSSSHHQWAALAHYAETPDHFAVFSGDKQAIMVMVLPKRGLAAPEDADRLRAILDGNLTRV